MRQQLNLDEEHPSKITGTSATAKLFYNLKNFCERYHTAGTASQNVLVACVENFAGFVAFG